MRLYIGARYTPKFEGEYDATQSYEALSVVDNGSGTSYISKKPTPAGTPLTNTTYWTLYGSTTGAIINLQQQIDEMKNGSVPGSLQNQITANTDDIADLNNDMTGEIALRSSADNLLSERITNEVTARTSADNTLSGRISDEVAARTSADNTINARIDQIVAPSGEAPSAAEVADARVGADGTTYSTLGDAIRGQFTNVKNECTDGLVDVADAKLDVNHFIEEVDFDSVGFVDRTGTIQPLGGGDWYRSNYIPLRNVRFIIANLNDNNAVYQIYFYTNTRSPISGVSSGLGDGKNHIITLSKEDFPATAEYVIFTARVDSAGTGYFASCYYDYDIANDLYVNDKFEEESLSFTSGKFIDTSGNYQNSADWKIGAIKVDTIDHIKVRLTPNPAVLNINFYDADEVYISSINTSHLRDLVVYASDIPSNAAFIVFCGANSDSDIVKIYYRKYDETSLHTRELDFPNNAYRKPDGSVQTVSSGWKSTNLIPLKDVVRLYWRTIPNPQVSNVSFFDKMSNYLTGLNLSSVSYLGGYNVLDAKDFPSNAEYVEISGSDDSTRNKGKILTRGNMVNKTLITMGDSIVSKEVCGTGEKIADELHMNIVDLAHGNATTSDYFENGENITIESPTVDYLPNGSAEANSKNVLSNQIRNAICKAYNVGATVTYTHPVSGNFTLDNLIWSGTGESGYSPDAIYISIGINDGGVGTEANLPYHEDSATVIAQTYSELTRETLSSGLRWAIETLQSVYPKTDIYVTSLLATGADVTARMKWPTCDLKRTSIKNICAFCGVHFIDQFYESCYSRLVASGVGSNDGIHPKTEWARINARYLAKQIDNNYRNTRS